MNIIQKLFSIKNTDTHKVLTIFGIKIKLPRRKDIDLSTKLDIIYKTLDENRYANVFHDTIQDSEWLIKKSFSPIFGAANYSLLYILYRILNEARPDRILEMGLGQTTLMTTQYAKSFNNITLDVVDHQKEWVDLYKQRLTLNDNTKFHVLKLENFKYNNSLSPKYADIAAIPGPPPPPDTKYNFIIIDGPIGQDYLYPRTNILDLIPKYLSEEFIILLDDAERIGERNTAELIFEKLKHNGIDYSVSYRCALKTQLIIMSKKYSYISYL